MFSDRFVNVLDDFGTPLSDLGDALARAERGLAEAGVSGAVVFYVGRSCTLRRNASVRVSASIEFAPGAVVTLSPGVVLDINGDAELTIGQHFRLGGAAEVRLLGPIDAIRPEWFGVSPESADDALASAYRVALLRAERGVSAAPLALAGSYTLTRAWELTVPPGVPLQSIELVLVGRHPTGDPVVPPTLAGGEDFSGASLLSVGSGVTLRMTEVALRFAGALGGSGAALLRLDGDNDQTTLEGCSFFAGTATAIVARNRRGEDGERLTMRRCWVEGSVQNAAERILVQLGAGGDRSRVTLEGCSFIGASAAMVSALAGTLEVMDCLFVNADRTGVDIDIGSGSGGIAVADWTAGLALIETHVRSESVFHLRGESPAGRAADVVAITGLCHDPPGSRVATTEAIVWRGPIRSGLLIQGCNLGGSVTLRDSSSDVVSFAIALRGGATIRTNSGGRIREAAPPTWRLPR